MINLKTYIASFVIMFSAFNYANITYGFETNAKQAYLMDYNTRNRLFEKNSEERMVPSSMTKVMTSYLIFNHLKEGTLQLEDELTVSENAWRTGGTKMFVDLNSKIRVEDLLRGIIVQSGNDACKVLAEGIYGDEDVFAENMNEQAKQLGMKNSNFKNASGLPNIEHYSTAKDIAILAAAIIQNFPQYYHYFSETEFAYNKIHQYNKNTLLNKRGVDGLKTGHTDAGGYGIVASAVRDGRRLIAVVNGLNTEKERILEADKLLSFGFSNFVNKKLYKAGNQITEAKVWYGRSDKVSIITPSDIEITLPKSIGKKFEHITRVIHTSPIKAPIQEGDILAKLVIEHDGKEIFSQDLVALESIEQANFFERGIQNIKYYLKKFISM